MSFIFFKRTTIYFIFLSTVFITILYSQKKDLKKEPFDVQNGSLSNYEKYIYYRNRGNKLKINKRNLKTIYKVTKNSEDDYYHLLKLISIGLSNENIVGKELSFSERVYVHAYVTEYLYKCQETFKMKDIDKDVRFVTWVLGEKYRNSYNEEFKKHNYYGLKRLKKRHIERFSPFEDPRVKKPTELVY